MLNLTLPMEEIMIRYLKKAIPLSILASGIMASASFADTFTLRVGSGHPSNQLLMLLIWRKF